MDRRRRHELGGRWIIFHDVNVDGTRATTEDLIKASAALIKTNPNALTVDRSGAVASISYGPAGSVAGAADRVDLLRRARGHCPRPPTMAGRSPSTRPAGPSKRDGLRGTMSERTMRAPKSVQGFTMLEVLILDRRDRVRLLGLAGLQAFALQNNRRRV